ncbi:MAG: FAD binding domain-containing protein [Nitrososphaerota archaeon]|nr:FAD binding domain-containing protein [Nitrososphaerota archaeon]
MRTEVTKFGVHYPTSIGEAISLLSQYGQQAAVMSGGTDIISRNKNRIKLHMFTHLIDISGLSLNYLNQKSDGYHIGASASINQVATDPGIASSATVLSQAAGQVATLQIRNMGTVSGDVLQEVWCPYLRNNYNCWRNGGNVCYGAIGDNRYYHSVFGGRLCYAVHAGDLAPALMALNASAVVHGALGTRSVSMEQLLPGINVIGGVVKENTVGHNEILSEFHVPTQPSNQKSTFYKVRDRGTWDFSLASAAVALSVSGNTVSNARIVLGGVGVVPFHARAAESYINGKQLTESTFTGAANAAVQNAQPLTYGTGNAFRVELARGAVKKALRAISQM